MPDLPELSRFNTLVTFPDCFSTNESKRCLHNKAGKSASKWRIRNVHGTELIVQQRRRSKKGFGAIMIECQSI
uniref:Uncharacterized protein n=1 Tax=Romanomermis culicivorax TaxID=13658 RepID=A0A915JBZ2_ROMCU